MAADEPYVHSTEATDRAATPAEIATALPSLQQIEASLDAHTHAHSGVSCTTGGGCGASSSSPLKAKVAPLIQITAAGTGKVLELLSP